MGAARRPLPTVLVDGVLYAVTPLTPRRKTGDGRFLLQSEWGEYYACLLAHRRFPFGCFDAATTGDHESTAGHQIQRGRRCTHGRLKANRDCLHPEHDDSGDDRPARHRPSAVQGGYSSRTDRGHSCADG